jgi:maltokinase
MAQIGADPARLIIELGELGAVTAALHNALASDASDPAFRPEEPSGESMSMMMATVEEDVERIFARLPEDERLAAIAGRGPDVRERIASRGWVAGGGRAIRTHGDLHLGQTLRLADDWLIIDFEGEPARPLHERRRKHSPLRDVAGMLRSFAYAAAAARLIHGTWVPAQFEQRAREAFLERYFASVDAALLPPGEAATADLLSIFELEKAVYELRYELDNRPDWLAIPAAGIAALLEVT